MQILLKAALILASELEAMHDCIQENPEPLCQDRFARTGVL